MSSVVAFRRPAADRVDGQIPQPQTRVQPLFRQPNPSREDITRGPAPIHQISERVALRLRHLELAIGEGSALLREIRQAQRMKG